MRLREAVVTLNLLSEKLEQIAEERATKEQASNEISKIAREIQDISKEIDVEDIYRIELLNGLRQLLSDYARRGD